MGPPCAFFYEIVAALATRIVEVWKWVAAVIQQCGTNKCNWWCLCCDRWACWIGIVLLGIVLTILLIVFLLLSLIFVVVCWILCLIGAVLQAIGRVPVSNCFAGTPPPPPPANQGPTAVTDGPYRGTVGQTITMSAAASTDPEGTPLTASWTLGDGTTDAGLTISHAYSNPGLFTVTVTVTDGTLTSTATTTANIIGIGGGPPPIDEDH